MLNESIEQIYQIEEKLFEMTKKMSRAEKEASSINDIFMVLNKFRKKLQKIEDVTENLDEPIKRIIGALKVLKEDTIFELDFFLADSFLFEVNDLDGQCDAVLKNMSSAEEELKEEIIELLSLYQTGARRFQSIKNLESRDFSRKELEKIKREHELKYKEWLTKEVENITSMIDQVPYLFGSEADCKSMKKKLENIDASSDDIFTNVAKLAEIDTIVKPIEKIYTKRKLLIARIKKLEYLKNSLWIPIAKEVKELDAEAESVRNIDSISAIEKRINTIYESYHIGDEYERHMEAYVTNIYIDLDELFQSGQEFNKRDLDALTKKILEFRRLIDAHDKVAENKFDIGEDDINDAIVLSDNYLDRSYCLI